MKEDEVEHGLSLLLGTYLKLHTIRECIENAYFYFNNSNIP